jgi:hypothetical protein
VTTGQWAGVGALAAGAVSDGIIVSVVPAATGAAAIPVAQADVSEVDCKIDVYGGTVAGGYILGSGLYIGEYDDVNAVFSNQQPLVIGDAARDNWMALRVGAVSLPLNAATTTALHYSTLSFTWKGRVLVDMGLALKVILQNSNLSSGGINFSLFVRSRYKWVR